MFKSFLISIFAILLFSLGATGAWFYMQMEKSNDGEDDGLPVMVAEQPAGPADPVPKFTPTLPAAGRGPELSPEDIYKLETATAAQREQLIEHEKRLREQNRRIITSNADTKAAQREVDGSLEQLRNMMDAAEKLLTEVTAAKDELKQQVDAVQQQKDELKAVEEAIGTGAKANIKAFSEVVAGMPAAESAALVVDLANEGQADFAIQLLRNLEPRTASKLLAEVKDGPLRAEFAKRFRDMIQIR